MCIQYKIFFIMWHSTGFKYIHECCCCSKGPWKQNKINIERATFSHTHVFIIRTHHLRPPLQKLILCNCRKDRTVKTFSIAVYTKPLTPIATATGILPLICKCLHISVYTCYTFCSWNSILIYPFFFIYTENFDTFLIFLDFENYVFTWHSIFKNWPEDVTVVVASLTDNHVQWRHIY